MVMAILVFAVFWFAQADTDSGGQLFGFGLACRDRLFGRAGVIDDANIETGRYRLRGEVAPMNEATADEGATVEEETTTE